MPRRGMWQCVSDLTRPVTGIKLTCLIIFSVTGAAQVRQCNAGLKHKEGDYYDSLAAGYSVLVAGTPAPQEVSPRLPPLAASQSL